MAKLRKKAWPAVCTADDTLSHLARSPKGPALARSGRGECDPVPAGTRAAFRSEKAADLASEFSPDDFGFVFEAFGDLWVLSDDEHGDT
jgi:hypothetical protein